MEDKFKQAVQGFVDQFIQSDGPIRIICRNNVDALCGASILTKVFTKIDKKFNIQIINELTLRRINQLPNYKDGTFFFIDVGSTSLDKIKDALKNKKIFFFSRAETYFSEGINVINPYLYFDKSLNPRSEISIAGMCYYFAKALDSKNKDLSYLGFLGKMADNIKASEFSKLNQKIIDDAIFSKALEIKKGIKLPLAHSCPAYKSIANSISPFIPGVAGSEKNAAKFLNEIGINGDNKRQITDLEENEIKKLVTNIVLRRLGSDEGGSELIGDVYLINVQGYYDELSDVYEAVHILEACISLGESSLALAFCINPVKNNKKAYTMLKIYRKLMMDSLSWFSGSRKSDRILNKSHFVMINGVGNVDPKISLHFVNNLAESNIYEKGKMILFCNGVGAEDTEIIIRVVGDPEGTKLNFDKLLDASVKLYIKEQKLIRQNGILRVASEHEEELLKSIVSRLDSQELVEDVE